MSQDKSGNCRTTHPEENRNETPNSGSNCVIGSAASTKLGWYN